MRQRDSQSHTQEREDSQAVEESWRQEPATGILRALTTHPETSTPVLLETCGRPDLCHKPINLQKEVLELHQGKENRRDGSLPTQGHRETHN